MSLDVEKRVNVFRANELVNKPTLTYQDLKVQSKDVKDILIVKILQKDKEVEEYMKETGCQVLCVQKDVLKMEKEITHSIREVYDLQDNISKAVDHAFKKNHIKAKKKEVGCWAC